MEAVTINTDILLLTLLTAITAVSYLVAINSTSITKMAISFLIATIILASDIFMIVSYVSQQKSQTIEQEYKKRLAEEKETLKKKVIQNSVNKEDLKEQALKSDEVLKVQRILNKTQRIASDLASMNLQDYTLTIDDKISRAARLKRTVEIEYSKYKSLKPSLVYVKEASIDIALTKLVKGALYCKLYYSAEDGDQEAVRERVMRTSAKESGRLLRDINQKLERMK